MEVAITTIAVLFIGVLVLLYLMGIPIAFAMGITSTVIFLLPIGPSLNLQLMGTRVSHSLTGFTMLAVPIYLLLGRLMNAIGMTERIFGFARAAIGSRKGGIGYVNILASMLFAGMSGTASADVAALGRVEYSAMRDDGYDVRTAIGITGSSSIIGPIIPPSLHAIVYGVLADVSIGALFLGGVLPGILIGTLLMIWVFFVVRIKNLETSHPFSFSVLVKSFIEGFVGLVIPVFIIGGLTLGFFTATEAGGIAVMYTVLIGFLLGELTVEDLITEIKESSVETFAILIILAMASLYSLAALQLQLPQLITESLLSLSNDPFTVLVLICIILLITGTFMPGIVSITVLTPILIPTLNSLGISLIYFGVLMLVVLMIGLLSPPFGMVLFVLEKVTGVQLEDIMIAMVQFITPILIGVIILLLFPDIVTFLPNTFY